MGARLDCISSSNHERANWEAMARRSRHLQATNQFPGLSRAHVSGFLSGPFPLQITVNFETGCLFFRPVALWESLGALSFGH